MEEGVAQVVGQDEERGRVGVRVADGLEDPHVERDGHRCDPRLGRLLPRRRLPGQSDGAVRRQRADQTRQKLLEGGDHRLLARDDDPQRVAAEQVRPDFVERRNDTAQLVLLQLCQAAHRVQHSDPLQAVVDRAFRAQLRVSAQQGELETQARERAFEPSRYLGDDLLQAPRFDLQPCDEVGEQLDERLSVAVEGPA